MSYDFKKHLNENVSAELFFEEIIPQILDGRLSVFGSRNGAEAFSKTMGDLMILAKIEAGMIPQALAEVMLVYTTFWAMMMDQAIKVLEEMGVTTVTDLENLGGTMPTPRTIEERKALMDKYVKIVVPIVQKSRMDAVDLTRKDG